jgi:hypothetical protein
MPSYRNDQILRCMPPTLENRHLFSFSNNHTRQVHLLYYGRTNQLMFHSHSYNLPNLLVILASQCIFLIITSISLHVLFCTPTFSLINLRVLIQDDNCIILFIRDKRQLVNFQLNQFGTEGLGAVRRAHLEECGMMAKRKEGCIASDALASIHHWNVPRLLHRHGLATTCELTKTIACYLQSSVKKHVSPLITNATSSRKFKPVALRPCRSAMSHQQQPESRP